MQSSTQHPKEEITWSEQAILVILRETWINTSICTNEVMMGLLKDFQVTNWTSPRQKKEETF